MLALGQTARLLSQEMDIKREKHLVHTLGPSKLKPPLIQQVLWESRY